MSFGTRVLNGQPGHHVDRVGAADADRDHAEAARVRRVAVGADHHPAGERVLLEHDLVDDPGARLPEADAVLRRHGAQELVDLGVHVERALAGRRRRRRGPGSGGRSARCVGTATVGSPAVMNCSSAICAVASCIATRSGR